MKKSTLTNIRLCRPFLWPWIWSWIHRRIWLGLRICSSYWRAGVGPIAEWTSGRRSVRQGTARTKAPCRRPRLSRSRHSDRKLGRVCVGIEASFFTTIFNHSKLKIRYLFHLIPEFSRMQSSYSWLLNRWRKKNFNIFTASEFCLYRSSPSNDRR